VKKWFFVEVSFMKPALLRSPINRTPTIWGFFTSLLAENSVFLKKADLAGKLLRALEETEMSTSLLPGLPLDKTCKASRIG